LTSLAGERFIEGAILNGAILNMAAINVSLVLLLAALALLPITPIEAAQNETRSAFRFTDTNATGLFLTEGDRPVLVYNYGVITRTGLTNAASHSAYVHPLYGLDGEILTGDFPKDHPYHRGLFWAWPHIQITQSAGTEYDLWSLRGIEQKFQRWLARDTTQELATLGVENGWFVGEKKVMREEVWLRVQPATRESRSIDVELTWTPLDQPITLSGAPEKSYGGLTLRFAERSRSVITVQSGWTAEDLLMTKLPWADFAGNFQTNEALSGAAIFVHPDHPAFPPEWMTRHYGVLAVGYPGVTPKTFAPNQSFTCRYRIWVHRGNPAAATIQRAFDSFSAAAKNSTEKTKSK
jgi:hypothetical protein